MLEPKNHCKRGNIYFEVILKNNKLAENAHFHCKCGGEGKTVLVQYIRVGAHGNPGHNFGHLRWDFTYQITIRPREVIGLTGLIIVYFCKEAIMDSMYILI